MRILVDTVSFIYAMETSERLSRKAKSILEDPNTAGELSVISFAEIALKNATGKLNFGRERVME